MPVFQPEKGIPVIPIDETKRYDIYVYRHSLAAVEERVFENVRILAIRIIGESGESSRLRGSAASAIGGFLEVETINGRRMMLARHGIHAICEHGTTLAYRVVTDRPPEK